MRRGEDEIFDRPSEREVAQHQLDDYQALLDLEQVVGDREWMRLDYQQVDADIGLVRMTRERDNTPSFPDDAFGLEMSLRDRRQSTGDEQVNALGRQQDRTDQAQMAHDQAQWRHDETATAAQADAEREARGQRTLALEARADARRARDQAREGTEQARRIRDLP